MVPTVVVKFNGEIESVVRTGAVARRSQFVLNLLHFLTNRQQNKQQNMFLLLKYLRYQIVAVTVVVPSTRSKAVAPGSLKTEPKGHPSELSH